MGEEEAMIGATDVVRELGIPRSSLYRLVEEKRVPVHHERKPWQKRGSIRFKLSEVRAALNMPPGPTPPAPG